jgi:hypothetical protein
MSLPRRLAMHFKEMAEFSARENQTTILDDSGQYLRAREAEAMCDHVWIFEARTLSTQPVRATMRQVASIVIRCGRTPCSL